ncbi:amidohydrolase [Hydrogenoanaerobacterium saccharovorans]|uniref:Amidohydrolase n=1 Tax=Hydrogenoanaerobacterium saccharovorans TaxID=474960 RepID=A0ABS2GKT5_9FIRM|nr:amidohydrolase [Hydrogenoanaerobacterium saccharovorans]MBM6923107.1 amidohydrolase [Hydrogenoanaerobacterium saccharovorans]
MEMVNEIKKLVDAKKEAFLHAGDLVWEYAEIGFKEFQSAKALTDVLKAEGFAVEEGVAGIPTAFVASWGEGKPIIGLLGEYDALPALKHAAGDPVESSEIVSENGHGCGHNLLGAGALGAAVAVKDYMQAHGLKGTIRYYGCPGEEFGSGKMFMARAGLFDDLDAAFTWHGGAYNAITADHSLANLCAYFKFKGRTSHAAGSPHLGRSALDACELMNVGCNYLREHILPDERIHYAYTDVGGSAPNVVQDHACVFYYVRSPRLYQVLDLYERVKDVARGAALMTGTQLEIVLNDGLCDYVPNDTLSKLLYESFCEAGGPKFSEEEKALAAEFAKTFDPAAVADKARTLAAHFGPEVAEKYKDQILVEDIFPYHASDMISSGSTDVGDVSYCAPTAQMNVSTWALCTTGHTWQVTAQSGSDIGRTGTVKAAEVLALASIKAMQNPELLEKAKEEWKKATGGKYVCPVTDDVQPAL